MDAKFGKISPTAYSLLESKALTTLPFAKECFTIISEINSKQIQDDVKSLQGYFSMEKFNVNELPIEVIARILHFEARYRSIDKGLQELTSSKILELASGFSFRGLDFCKNPAIHFIDTDLPEVIEPKRELVTELITRYCDYRPTNLTLQPLNALHEEELLEAIASFEAGPLTIVNEGLLIYLDREQKKSLCETIHKILSTHGGYWINADIYRAKDSETTSFDKFYSQKDQEFRAKTNLEANKFQTYEMAIEFFSSCGFEIFKKMEIDPEELSASKLLHQRNLSTKDLKDENPRETWILKAV